MAQEGRPPSIANGVVGDWRLSDDAFLASFHLPRFDQRVDVLKARHPLPREGRISFREDVHEYTVDGVVKVPRSVTGVVHSYASHFDSLKAVACMRKGRNWEHKQHEFAKECGEVMTDEEIVQLWQDRGKVASARGTLLHYHAETFLNGCLVEPPHSREFTQVLDIIHWLRDAGWEPYRTEVCLFHCQLALAGQCDALFFKDTNTGDLAIVDWKRSKRISFDSPFQRLSPPLEHLEDCNGWLYSLQLNVYRYVLESEYGCHVAAMYIAQVHSDLPGPRVIRCPRMGEEIELIIEDQVAKGLAWSSPSPGECAPFVLPS
jgi:hypothetical protein